MIVTRKRVKFNFSYQIYDLVLKSVDKYLGVIISSNLSWTAHVKHVTSKA